MGGFRRALLNLTLALGLLIPGLLAGDRPASAREDVCPEPNDAPARACPIGGNSSAAGYLDSPADVDRYRIEVGEGQTVLASLSTLPFNYTLRLETGDGEVLAEATGGGTEDRALGKSGLTAGTYYLTVLAAGDLTDSRTAYTLQVSVQGTVARPNYQVDPNAPPPPPAADRPLDQLVLIEIEAGEKAKQSGKPVSGSDERSSWYEVTYKRDKNDHKLGPLYMVNRVYRAKDLPNAQLIFKQQAGAGLPEAKLTNPNYKSLGPQSIPPVGDEASAVGAGQDFEKDVVTRHYRIVFRIGTLVETLYTYGPDTGNNADVAFGFAKELEKRINTPPEGPPPEIVSKQSPGEIGIRQSEAGRFAVTVFEKNGCEARGCWYEGRFHQPPETYGQRMGPVQVYNKVFVANDNESARAVYQEYAVFDLPEAKEAHGALFNEPKTKPFGNESYAIGACNDDCMGAQTESLHERLVFRWGNVVSIVYIWGRQDQANPDVVGDFANRIIGRIR